MRKCRLCRQGFVSSGREALCLPCQIESDEFWLKFTPFPQGHFERRVASSYMAIGGVAGVGLIIVAIAGFAAVLQ